MDTHIFKYDDNDLTLTLTLPDDDRQILNELLTLQRDAAQYLFDAAHYDLTDEIRQTSPMTQFDYNGDHVDYNTAAAAVLASITNEFCGDGHFRTDFRPDIFDALVTPNDTDKDPHDDHYRTPRSTLAYLLSDSDFINDLFTWSDCTSTMIAIDFS